MATCGLRLRYWTAQVWTRAPPTSKGCRWLPPSWEGAQADRGTGPSKVGAQGWGGMTSAWLLFGEEGPEWEGLTSPWSGLDSRVGGML